jgi:glycosyltransferase involved in cell wall biosynthesis
MVGTIEPRKNHLLVLDAFEQLFDSTPDLELTFIGRLDWGNSSIGRRLQSATTKYPRLQVIGDANDDVVRRSVQNARATIFVSAAEGFGLPPVESLWLGTPVIASAGVPSLEEIGDKGIHVVNELTPAGIRDAVVRFLDDSYYATKAHEAGQLTLPDWKSFASGIVKWVTDISTSELNS